MLSERAPHPRLERYYESERDHHRYVRSLFDDTARHYNRITSLMSFGTVVWYRQDALRRAGLEPGMQVLDVATGTGPVALAASRLLEGGKGTVAGGGKGAVAGVDPSLGMLVAGLGCSPRPKICGKAESLPFRDASFDFLVMGYALRHVETLESAFREYRRVLRPGGTVLILELTRPPRGWRLAVARFYLGRLLPAVSGLISGNRRARELMAFYWDTIESCVPPETILESLASSGLSETRHQQRYSLLSEYTARR